MSDTWHNLQQGEDNGTTYTHALHTIIKQIGRRRKQGQHVVCAETPPSNIYWSHQGRIGSDWC